MPKPDNIIRIGDKIRIVNPEFFVRCGYKLGMQQGKEYVESHRQEIDNLLYSMDLPQGPHTELEEQLAYIYIKSRQFGGDERILHTVKLPNYMGSEAEVTFKKFVRTGTRQYPTRLSQDTWERPYLGNAKTHVILELRCIRAKLDDKDIWMTCEPMMRIEAKNVIKLC